jgi:3'-phosphoadenosine 5'-phosphosulfate sulfotransferase (PAPS reductase)/FAD synthetase
MTFVNKIQKQRDMSKWTMRLNKELTFDTAEMYSVPAREETYGSTERILGTWFKKQEEGRSCFGIKIGGPNLILLICAIPLTSHLQV